VNINLSNNRIRMIEGLIGLTELKSLDLLGNLLPDTAACEELLHLPSLSSLDLTGNQISDH
jgi:Leucine-rich repeat (LRR) protein